MACNDFPRQANERIIIQSPTETGDAFGGRSVSWSNLGTYWAVVTPLSGSEIIAQNTTQSRTTHKFTIRYQSGLKDITDISDHRISFDDRYFAINYIRNLDRNMKNHGTEYQEIFTEENGADING